MRRLVIGLCAGVVAGFVMNQFSRAATHLTGGREGDAAAPGSDRVGRGAQPPQAEGDAGQDAAVRVGTAAYELVTGARPSRRDEPRLGTAAHYVFSASLGVAYALLRERVPAITAGRGALFGAAVWVIADEGVIPALGLSRGPRELGRAVLLYGLAAHLVYGLSLDAGHDMMTPRARIR
jgi:hypothetical protein